MKYANLNFDSAAKAKQFVKDSENEYLSDVKAACDMAQSGGRIITLCGPSCSGKTTTALILDNEFKKNGKELHTVSIDDFYFDRDFLIERSEKMGTAVDYDSPATIDLELFGKVIEDIEKGGKVLLPKFDFSLGKRVGFEEITVRAEDIFLFEGIQAVYPDFTKFLSGHSYTSLFISVEEELNCGGVTFEPRTLRLMRRLVRDKRTRATEAQRTLEIWQGVVANEDMHIYPNLGGIDYKINSLMAYEAAVIKPFAEPLLESIMPDSEFKSLADGILEKLSSIPAIESEYVPDGSVFREFIGERK